MQEELTVRVEHPELPAIRWNEAEVQQNLTEMLAAYTGRVYTPETIKDAKATDAECKIFLETCKQYRLNPFTKEAYLIHYDNNSEDTPQHHRPGQELLHADGRTAPGL